ncbi:conserved hypothetical protein [Histoplasma capsulatum H143]|uniref:Formin GTPase-binding domain-containing protein n=1 Tax=Ajellomyces capsulatus (strain H143) TaxID=544712 RepID=C6HIU2_AJECH|nr:conserved hypothetical protein [Histoplasma capsulatum H143]
MSPAMQNSGIFVDEQSGHSKTSGLRSIFPSKAHKRNHSAGSALIGNALPNDHTSMPPPMLPLDHPHSYTQWPLSEVSHNGHQPSNARLRNKSSEANSDYSLHKKTKSSVSLRSLMKDFTTPNKTPSPEITVREKKAKKTKSSTSLSAIFRRSQRGRRDNTSNKQQKDKENMNPPHSPTVEISPLYSHFGSTSQQQVQGGNRYLPERGRTLDEEMSLYTPRGYSPSKQRNFHGHQLPFLTKRSDTKPRPKSEFVLPTSSSMKDMLASVQRSGASNEQQWQKAGDSRANHDQNTSSGSANGGKDSSGKGSRSQSRTRPFSISRADILSPKRSNENMTTHKRPKSVDLSRPGSSKGLPSSNSMTGIASQAQPDHTADPTDFVHYLREVQKPEIIEVGKLHKLRILLRNETVTWVDAFISHGGMNEIIELLYRILKVEWREEHEDALLHETLLCLKALCTTSLALRHLSSVESVLFPTLLHMLFDEEKKGPSEFTTRGIVLSLLFTHLSSASAENLVPRAKTIMAYMRDPTPPEESQPLNFIASIYQPRPYRVWCKEISNVTKEVFWIFLHQLNVVPVTKATEINSEPYSKRYFPPPRPPVPAAPYVGGVEWDATNYIANHLDLLNGLLAALPTASERNTLRTELRASGFEKVMGTSLRTCKEKFYSSVHDSLKLWVAAAAEDGWDYKFVREGPARGGPDSTSRSPIKSTPGSPKKRVGLVSDEPPKLDLTGEIGHEASETSSGWL